MTSCHFTALMYSALLPNLSSPVLARFMSCVQREDASVRAPLLGRFAAVAQAIEAAQPATERQRV